MADPAPPLSLKIPKAHVRKGAKGNEVVFYEIRSSRRVAQPSADEEDVTSRLITDVAFKRFSDFALLDAKLRKNFPSLSNLPALPPKKMFGNLEPKFVERRRAELEAYLSVLVEHDGGPDEAGGAVGSQHLTLLQASQDLRAFVPQGYLKEQLEDLLRFEVIEVNTFGLNRSMQLTVQPHASGVLQFRDASGSGGLDSQTNKIVIGVCDIAGVTEVEGSHVRCALSFYTDDKGTSSNSTPARNPRSGAGANPSTAPSSVASVAASSYMAASSLSSTNTRLQLNPLCDWADPESTTAALEPTGSPSSSLNPSSAAAITARAKKKVLEFACFEDRHRFIRLCKWLRETAAAAAAAMSARRTSLSTASLSSSSFVGMDPSPSCIENHPTSTWASVFTTTWNQAKEPEPENLSQWLPKDGGNFDLLAIGTQECPTALSALSDAIQKHLGSGYYVVGRKALWEMKIIVFARNELPLGTVIHRVETDSVATGIMGIMGNKGGVGVSFKLHSLSVCFVNTHLAPHMERYADRNRMFDEIDASLRLGLGAGLGELDASLKFDALFWLGDLNYRVEVPHHHVLQLSSNRQFDLLFPKDQLRRAQWSQDAFAGYSEGCIKFPPTYKYVMPKKKGKQAESSANANATSAATGAKDAQTAAAASNASAGEETSGAGTASTTAALPSVVEESESDGGAGVTGVASLQLGDSDSSLPFTRLASRSTAVLGSVSEFDGESSSDDEDEEEEEEEEHSEAESDDDGADSDAAESDESESDSTRDSVAAAQQPVADSPFLPSMLSTSAAAFVASNNPSTLSSSLPADAFASTMAAADLDQSELFDSLDPDFSTYTHTRVRAHADDLGSAGSAAMAAAHAASTSSAALPRPSAVAGGGCSSTNAAASVSANAGAPVPPASAGASSSTAAAASSSPSTPARPFPSGCNGNAAALARLSEQLHSGPLSASGIAQERRVQRRSIKGDGQRRRSATVAGAPKRRTFTRAYGKKRIPSWCDRILYRMYRPEMAHLKSYYRCDGVTTSDHIPVVATFDLRVPLCPPLQAYSHPCSIRIRSLTLDLTVHPLKLHRASLDFLDKIYVVFTGPFLAETSRAKRTGYASLRNADGTPRVGGARPAGSDMPLPANQAKADGSGGGGGSGGSSSAQQDEPDLRPTVVLASWDELEIPILQSVLGQHEFIALERVFFVIKSGDELGGSADLVLGQGHISLQSLHTFFARDSNGAGCPFVAAAPAHISAGAAASKAAPSPFPLALSEGQDGSVGVGCSVRAPPLPGMARAPSPGATPNSWHFCSLVERHSAANGTLQGHIFVNIERPDEQPTKSEEQLIEEVLAD